MTLKRRNTPEAREFWDFVKRTADLVRRASKGEVCLECGQPLPEDKRAGAAARVQQSIAYLRGDHD